jgi:hypothetical protein
MDLLIEKLHTAARRYCIDRYNYWQVRYSYLPNHGRCADEYHYSDEALSIFPRYNLLKAILIEIEGFVPQDFSTFTEAKALIILATSTANDIFTSSVNGSIEKSVMAEERTRFIDFIKSLSPDELSKIEPLFFRRTISSTESQSMWAKLIQTWGVDKPHGVMYPITRDNPLNAIFLDMDCFDREIGIEILRSMLAGCGIKRVWELREYGPEYEIDINAFDPSYGDGGEGYWFTSEFNWIIYASHEGTITFNGWIKDAVNKIYKDRNISE